MKSAANICGHLWCYAVLLKEAYPCTLKGLLQSGNKRQELFQHSLAPMMAKPSSQPSALVYHQHMAKAMVPATAPATRTLCSSPLWLLPSQAILNSLLLSREMNGALRPRAAGLFTLSAGGAGGRPASGAPFRQCPKETHLEKGPCDKSLLLPSILTKS